MDSDGQMTDYERMRLENIKRNSEMLASLNVHARLSDLSASFKRRQREEEKSYKHSSEKKKKTESPIVIRRSMRTRGMPPDSKGLPKDFNESLTTRPKSKSSKLAYLSESRPAIRGPLSMKDAYCMEEGSYRAIVEKIEAIKKAQTDGEGKLRTSSAANCVLRSPSKVGKMKLEESIDVNSTLESKNFARVSEGKRRTRSAAIDVSRPPSMLEGMKLEDPVGVNSLTLKYENIAKVCKGKHTRSSANSLSRMPSKLERVKLEEPIDVNSLTLESKNIARVLPGRIFSVRFFPTMDMTMVVAGNKSGHLGFWDVKTQREEKDVIHLYQPHTAPISGIFLHPFLWSKVYTSSYDGFIRSMDVEREEFDLAYSSSSDSPIYSLSQTPDDAYTFYLGEGQGDLNVVDGRAREIMNSWSLHEGRINTIDFNPANPNIMATSSSDGLACLWDLRMMNVKHSKCTALQSLNHGRAVHSANFSPSGCSVATTSVDNNIGILCGDNFEDNFMIPHDNWTNRWISTFRAIWGWDDTHLFVGNMKRRVDVLSVNQRKTVNTLASPLMSAIPCRYDAHPCTAGMLAGATSGGQIYIWTTSL